MSHQLLNWQNLFFFFSVETINKEEIRLNEPTEFNMPPAGSQFFRGARGIIINKTVFKDPKALWGDSKD